MPAKKRAAEPKRTTQFKARWKSNVEVETVFADNLLLQKINDQYFLTFGSIQTPVLEFEEFPKDLSSVGEIRPVIRIALTQGGFARIAQLMLRHASPSETDK